ncbi:MAG: type VI secretion system baseplate subunit TssG [bacterium]
MADQARPEARDLGFLEALEAEPFRFGFFQAIRKLEAEFRDHARLGESVTVAEDVIRLGQKPTLAFAPSALASFRRGSEGEASRLEVFFFGLFGPNGPLPHHLTEYCYDRIRNAKDQTFARFADVFHHRMLSLFYRAWANAQPTASYDRPESDRFAAQVGSLFGLGMPSLRRRGRVADEIRFHFAGRLACQSRNAEGLQSLLHGYFGIGAVVEEFVGQWARLPKSSLCRLGQSPTTGTLGQTAIVGDRIWDRGQRFRITLGPMSAEVYRELLPGGKRLPELIELVRTYVHDEFVWDVRLLLSGEGVAPLELGKHGKLGWTTWLPSESPPGTVDDLLFDPLAKAG